MADDNAPSENAPPSQQAAPDRRPDPPPYRPDKGLIGYIEKGQKPPRLRSLRGEALPPLSDAVVEALRLLEREPEQLVCFGVCDRFESDRPAAVLVPVDEYEALEETVEILSDAGTMAAIDEGRRKVERGDIVTLDELCGELQSRR